ncbi:MAG: lipase maturation factor family protein [Cyanobacteria bacterium SZAS-4]|nr:lipase maturation factor family protein [Cyanobacteria bacterium SZAS-4]
MDTDLQLSANQATSPTYIFVRWLFLRGLGFVYFVAFASIFVQVLGLIGSHGILPAHLFLKEVGANSSSTPFLSVPTLFWIDCSDTALRFLPGLGIVFSMFIMAGICSGPLLILLWLMYLSVVTVGGDFMGFQWDALLLEVGFLSIFFAHYKWLDLPLKSRDERAKLPAPSIVVLWLFRFLLFKLMLSSGCVKLLSGDLTWKNLSALHYHYWTQPLPTPLGWCAAQLPDWFQSLSVAIMFFIELIVPFFIFVPGILRLFAAYLTMLLQVLILLTGNYTFFNILTLLLCLLLFDDSIFLKLKNYRFAKKLIDASVVRPASVLTKLRLAALVTVVVIMTLSRSVSFVPEPIKELSSALSPWCLVNGYGLFAVMTTTRNEIVVEASQDALHWEPYEFIFKPGDISRAPPWVAPYQPRLDWQMWFAALGTRQDSPWFTHFIFQLLRGSADVRALLKKEPFNGQLPKYVRATLYEYQFTNFAELTRSGAWWQRKYIGPFFPEASLRQPIDKTGDGQGYGDGLQAQ